jgi:acyl-CoA dehydrogenase
LGCGTPARTQAANTALSMKDRIPQSAMQLAMKVCTAAEVA